MLLPLLLKALSLPLLLQPLCRFLSCSRLTLTSSPTLAPLSLPLLLEPLFPLLLLQLGRAAKDMCTGLEKGVQNVAENLEGALITFGEGQAERAGYCTLFSVVL